jgi:hypothetical protein
LKIETSEKRREEKRRGEEKRREEKRREEKHNKCIPQVPNLVDSV